MPNSKLATEEYELWRIPILSFKKNVVSLGYPQTLLAQLIFEQTNPTYSKKYMSPITRTWAVISFATFKF